MNETSKLSADTFVIRKTDVVDAEVDGEIVALDIEKGSCYGLNKVGSRVWQIIADASRVGDIQACLMAEYEVDEETCQTQTLALLEDLLKEDLIRVVDEAPAKA